MDRMDKVNEQIKRELGQILLSGEVSDPRISFVSIQQVKTSRDLQHARVWVSVLTGKDEDMKQALKGLRSASGHLRRLVGQRIRMKYTPELIFVHDKSAENAFRVEEVLNEIHQQEDAEIVSEGDML